MVSRRYVAFEAQTRTLHQSLEELDSATGRATVVKAVVGAILGSFSATSPLTRWLTSRSRCLEDIYGLSDKLQADLDTLKSEWPSVKRDLSSWSEWVANPIKNARSGDEKNDESEKMSVAARTRLSELALSAPIQN